MEPENNTTGQTSQQEQPTPKTYTEAEYTALQTRADGLQTQLDEAKQTLKSFEGVDVKELQGKITQLTADLTAKEQAHQQKLADLEFRNVLDAAVLRSGARNAKAVTALLDLEMLKASKNQAADIQAALDKVKQENDYLFRSEEPIRNPVAESKTTGTDPLAAIRAAMGRGASQREPSPSVTA